jgi:hypothetical protein
MDQVTRALFLFLLAFEVDPYEFSGTDVQSCHCPDLLTLWLLR